MCVTEAHAQLEAREVLERTHDHLRVRAARGVAGKVNRLEGRLLAKRRAVGARERQRSQSRRREDLAARTQASERVGGVCMHVGPRKLTWACA